MQVRLLGPVDVMVDAVSRPLPGLRRKSVLAVLALHPGEVVGTGRLVDIVWAGAPPPTVASSLQVHISYLRRALRARDAIEARPPGYLLNLPADAIDAGRAMRLIAAVRDGDHAGNAARLAAALDLWRGPSLADVADVDWLRDQGRRLDEIRLDAVEQLAEARLALGDHLQQVGALEDLAAQHPFRERLRQLLILALYRCDRQADALAAYQGLRVALRDQLGIDPSPGSRDLEAAILRQDPRLDLSPPAVTVAPARITPGQLPPTVAAFTGRRDELAQLHAHLPAAPDADRPAHAATVVLVSGTAGVGKTSLAVQWAHEVSRRFPDGQLYVNLRGFDPGGVVMDPAEAVNGFLDALGVPHHQIPASVDAQASLYRSVLADRRVLVLADNARDEQQVRPLLPGSPGCLVVVTSRNQLPGLVAADGAQPITLDPPPAAEARQILVRRMGADRVETDPRSADDIVALCARLPLALAIAAARAALAPTMPLASVAAQLRNAAAPLDPFDGADPATNIRAVFSWSYRALSDPAARLFRLLGPCPGADIALPAAASVAGRPVSEVRRLLAELTRAHLLTEPSPDRFGFHELLRAYAIEQAQRHDGADERAAARRRFLDHHLHTAHAAARLLKPGRSRIDLVAPDPGVTPVDPADGEAALAWFAADRGVLLATATREPDGYDQHTWQLAWALISMLTTRGSLRDNELAQQAGLRAAVRLDDPVALAHAHRSLGKVHAELGRFDEAEHHSQAALRLFEEIDNPIAATDIMLNLGVIAERRDNLPLALARAERAYRLYDSLGHRAGQGYAAHNMGWVLGRLGEHHRALAACQEALDLLADVGDREATANTWDSLGTLHFATGNDAKGEHCYRQAVELYHRLGDPFREADVWVSLGEARQGAGNPEAARQAWRQALAVLGDLEPEATARIRSRLEAVTV